MSNYFAQDDYWENELQYGAVCDLWGTRRELAMFRHGGMDAADFRNFDEAVAPEDTPDELDPVVVRERLQANRLHTLQNYEQSGQFTYKQLRTIYLIWVLGLSLQATAKLEGVWPETIRQRIYGTDGYGGLEKKAPEFWEWWTFKNRRRRGGARMKRSTK